MDKVVLDTNVFLVSASRKSPFHWIFQRLMNGAYKLCVTTEILLEYEEIIEQKMGSTASTAAMGVLENLDNVMHINTYFQFGLLNDPDDNKFVDCAVAADADYIVSEDSDFKILRRIGFPRVQLIGIRAFQKKQRGR